MNSSFQLLLPSLSICALLSSLACTNSSAPNSSLPPADDSSRNSEPRIWPISHATFVMQVGNQTIYNDPVGGIAGFADMPLADIILVSDNHGDHLDTATLASIFASPQHSDQNTRFIVPQAVFERLSPKLASRALVLDNEEISETASMSIEALPMYNLRPEAIKYHAKGRGNGYLISIGTHRIYIAGDTEDIPEMRSLKGITHAFVPMNLPYTMPVTAAADAVLAFQPQRVYPYHYRGESGLSDVAAFAKTVEAGGNTKVILLDWYPEASDN